MEKNYYKNANEKLMFMENTEDSKQRHECDVLMFNRDILYGNTKSSIEGIRKGLH
ncbi:MAG: hypothetical protein PWQ37_2462 [Candidatus Petromonas sp.]|nr:hypothetical protein [Candidatus Petromonas sp.]